MLALLFFCVMPLEELIEQPGGGYYYYARDTQFCIITSYNGNSSLRSDAIWLEQQVGTWLITDKCKHRKDLQAACAIAPPQKPFGR